MYGRSFRRDGFAHFGSFNIRKLGPRSKLNDQGGNCLPESAADWTNWSTKKPPTTEMACAASREANASQTTSPGPFPLQRTGIDNAPSDHHSKIINPLTLDNELRQPIVIPTTLHGLRPDPSETTPPQPKQPRPRPGKHRTVTTPHGHQATTRRIKSQNFQATWQAACDQS